MSKLFVNYEVSGDKGGSTCHKNLGGRVSMAKRENFNNIIKKKHVLNVFEVQVLILKSLQSNKLSSLKVGIFWLQNRFSSTFCSWVIVGRQID